ncbi:BTB POZ domain-containing KCTD3 [Brachionus plicatilis]|uniref:BTB POZ domain-containing KCTD3 n=1 Tax=Brachionus plicatilis TaxID=10195 RepID=A0A3M7RD65_BRAPC|nr:BTB POZ domain-containing KCTD3 [Brachionus plicatilis]
MLPAFTSDIINLNVGGQKFSTSRQTLCSVPDSFFSSLMSGRIPSCRDEQGYIFIDRDPKYFCLILNFLRTRELNLTGIENISSLKNEAEFYAISPLVKRLILCEDLDRSHCGDILFTGFIPTPLIFSKKQNNKILCSDSVSTGSNKPGSVLRVGSSKPSTENQKNQGSNEHAFGRFVSHSRKSSNEVYTNYSNQASSVCSNATSSTTPTTTSAGFKCHSRNQSFDLKQIKTDLGILLTDCSHQTNNFASNCLVQVNLITGHQNWIAVAYSHYVSCYKLKDGMGWQLLLFKQILNR